MPETNPDDRGPLLGGGSRNFAALLLFAGTLLLLVLASGISWPLGPKYVDEGGVTSLRLAVSLIGTAMLFGFLLVGFFLYDIVERLKRLGGPAPPAPPAKGPGAPAA